MTEKLVSIVVPVFNTAEFLDECLSSLENQSYQNIEVICINDGSTDSSPDILRRFCKRNQHFVLIETENRGLSLARNEGIARSSGEWLLFVDSDDVLVHNAVETLVKRAESYSSDVIFFKSSLLDGDEDSPDKVADFSTNPLYVEEFDCGLDALASFAASNSWEPSACLQFLNLDFLRRSQLNFAPGIYHEDNLFTLQALIAAGPVAVIPDSLYLVRPNPNSITRVAKTARHVLGLLESHSIGAQTIAHAEKLPPRHQAGAAFVLNHIIHQARGATRQIPRENKKQEEKVVAAAIRKFHPVTQRHYLLLTLPILGHVAFLLSRLFRLGLRMMSR